MSQIQQPRVFQHGQPGYQIEEYILTKAPQYKFLLAFGREEVAKINPDLPEKELDLKLYTLCHLLRARVADVSKELRIQCDLPPQGKLY